MSLYNNKHTAGKKIFPFKNSKSFYCSAFCDTDSSYWRQRTWISPSNSFMLLMVLYVGSPCKVSNSLVISLATVYALNSVDFPTSALLYVRIHIKHNCTTGSSLCSIWPYILIITVINCKKIYRRMLAQVSRIKW